MVGKLQSWLDKKRRRKNMNTRYGIWSGRFNIIHNGQESVLKKLRSPLKISPQKQRNMV